MKNDTVQTNFTAGEVSPLLLGRTDVARYQNGLRKSRNFIGYPQGGIARRPGTQHRDVAKNEGRFIDFIFSASQSYVLEFTPGVIRFFRDGAQIKDAFTGAPYEVATPYTADDIQKIYYEQSADVLYLCLPNQAPRTLSRFADNNWTLALFETMDGPYISNPVHGVTLTLSGLDDTAEIESNVDLFIPVTDNNKYISFQEDDQWRLGQIVESYDARRAKIKYMTNVMLGMDQEAVVQSNGPVAAPYGRISPIALITHGTNVVSSDHGDTFTTQDAGKVIRVYDPLVTSPTSWASAVSPGQSKYKWYLMTAFNGSQEMASTAAFGAGGGPGTYKDYNINQVRVTLKKRTILANLASSAATFKSTDIGRKVRLSYSSQITWGNIIAFGTSSSVSVQLYESVPLDPDQRDNSTSPFSIQLSNNGATTKWQLGAWSNTTGWPSVCAFYQGRLFFGRTDTEPQTLWGSASDDYVNFAPTELDSVVTDTSAIYATLASTKLNEIVWMIGAKVLLVGTTGEEWQISSENVKDPLTSKNIHPTSDTAHGSQKFNRPVKVGKSTLFLSKSGKTLRKLYFDFSSDAFVTKDLTIIADHILREGGGAKQIVITKDPRTTIWVLRKDGRLASLTYEEEQDVYGWHLQEIAGRQAKVVSIATVPDPVTREDVLYLMVCRLIGDRQVYFVESLRDQYFEGQADPVFLDSSLSYRGTPVSSVFGLWHLEGESVGIVADGAYTGTQVVTGGGVTLKNPSCSVDVGLLFSSTATLLPPVVQNRAGNGVMHVQRITRCHVRVYEAKDFFYGEVEGVWKKESFRTTATPNNESSELRSEVRTVGFSGGYAKDPSPVFSQLYPYPLTILSVASDVEVSDHA